VSDIELFEAKERIAELERDLATVTAQKDALLSLLGVPDGKVAELARIIAERDRLREQVQLLSNPISGEQLSELGGYGDYFNEIISARVALRGEKEEAK